MLWGSFGSVKADHIYYVGLKTFQLLSILCSSVPYLCWIYFTNNSVQSVTSGNRSTVMALLCFVPVTYFIILQLVVNLYSFLLYLESPLVKITENCAYVVFNWTSQSIEKLPNTFPFFVRTDYTCF